MKRRTFLALGAGAFCDLSLRRIPLSWAHVIQQEALKEPFKISLAQWSLNRRLFGRREPKLDNLDFAKTARGFGIEAIEYVNQFFKDKAQDDKYLAQMKKRAADHGVKSVLIMCDGEGNLGDPDQKRRTQAVENHYKWVYAARYLGCHSIRVNAASRGSDEEQQKLVTDGLSRLCEYAAQYKMNVIVENHGGLSSNGAWLVGVMKRVNLPNCGTLPDFGNFYEYDRYQGVEDLMPFAKGVSAKSQDFDENGDEKEIDYYRMMRIVRDAGYNGYVGIEYEGNQLSEDEGIKATKRLLDKIYQQEIRVQTIFNGQDLGGWTKMGGGEWSVEDSILIGRNGQNWSLDPEKAGSWLRSEKQYADFRLELQYMINEGGNSGIFFRSAAEKNPSYTGYELQITDGRGQQPSNRSVSSIYQLVAPGKIVIRPPDQWNTVTIIARGPKIIVEMNHEKIIDTQQTRSLKGHLGLQNHDERSVVKYRNIRLQEL
ncbi:family 16 glycoside hydrolase [Planctomycetota bacterium]